MTPAPAVFRRGRAFLADHRDEVGPTVLSTAASGLSAATTLLLARETGAVQFGGYTVVVTVGTMLMTAALLNLNVVVVQELPRRLREQDPEVLSTALAAALALGAGVSLAALLAVPAVQPAFGIDAATMAYGVLFAVTTGLGLLAEGFLRGQRRYARVAALKLALAVGYLAASAYGLLVLDVTTFGPYVLLLAAATVLFLVAALAGQPVRPAYVSARLAGRLLRHGGCLGVTSALVMLVFGLDVLVLHHVATPEAVGTYAVYNGFPKRLLGIVLTEGVGLVLLPTLATLAKPELLRRIGRAAPPLGLTAAALSFLAGATVLRLLPGDYPYSLGLLALSAAGIGLHAVFNLYFFALSVDGTRGAGVVIRCLLLGLPPSLLLQALLIAGYGVAGGLVAFALTNAVLVALLRAVTGRVYGREQRC